MLKKLQNLLFEEDEDDFDEESKNFRLNSDTFYFLW